MRRSDPRRVLWAVTALAGCAAPGDVSRGEPRAGAVLTSAERVATTLRARADVVSIVVRVVDGDDIAAVAAAAVDVRAHGVRLGYWIEVARAPSLAGTQPGLMASLQGHDGWRALFPDAPVPAPGEVVKVFPYVPILSRAGFAAQSARVRALLAALPSADEVYLHGLQGAPSACGCGHPTCRWAMDYFVRAPGRTPMAGPEPYGPGAAAAFAGEVAAAAKGATVIPVWVGECGAGDARCHGVPCYDGRCWSALAEQWAPVASAFERLAVFVPSASIGVAGDAVHTRDAVAELARVERAGAPAVRIDESRLVPIVEGPAAAIPGAVVADVALEQSWEPRLWRP
ncbi:MAG: hypothetical protein R3F56_10255 [Planctomycetota bacterium]